MGLSLRAYAKRRGVSEAAVRRAVESQRISKLPDGTLDPDQADRDWDAHTDQSKPQNTVTGDAAESKSPGAVQARARARREVWNARRARLEVRRLQGQLIEVQAVREASFEVARAARDQLLAIPDRMAAVLAGTDTDECHRLLSEEIQRVCAELAKPIAPAPPPPSAAPAEPTPPAKSDRARASRRRS